MIDDSSYLGTSTVGFYVSNVSRVDVDFFVYFLDKFLLASSHWECDTLFFSTVGVGSGVDYSGIDSLSIARLLQIQSYNRFTSYVSVSCTKMANCYTLLSMGNVTLREIIPEASNALHIPCGDNILNL